LLFILYWVLIILSPSIIVNIYLLLLNYIKKKILEILNIGVIKKYCTQSYISIIPEGYIYFSKYRKVINKRSAIGVCYTPTWDSGLFITLVIASLYIMKVIFIIFLSSKYLKWTTTLKKY